MPLDGVLGELHTVSQEVLGTAEPLEAEGGSHVDPSAGFPSFPISPPLSLRLFPRIASESGFSEGKQMPRNPLRGQACAGKRGGEGMGTEGLQKEMQLCLGRGRKEGAA